MSASLAGLSLTAFAFITALLHYPAGRFADGLSHQTVILGGVVGLFGGSILLATSTTRIQFVVALLVYGLGMGLFMPAGIIHLSALFSEARGRVLGFNSGAAQLGGISASLLSIVVLAEYHWQAAFLLPLIGFFVLGFTLHVSRDGAYVVNTVPMMVRPTIKTLVTNSDRGRAIFAASMLMIAMEGTIAFLPTFLQTSKPFTPSFANNALALYFFIGLLINPIAGELADRYDPQLIAAGAVGVGVCGTGGLTLFDDSLVVLAAVALVAIGIGGFWPPFNKHLMYVLSDDGRGSEYGGARTIWVGIGSTGPAIVGIVGGALGYELAFGLLAVILGCSLFGLLKTDGYL